MDTLLKPVHSLCKPYGLEPILDFEFFENVMDVILDGVHRQMQPLGDLFVCQSLGDQVHNLHLAR